MGYRRPPRRRVENEWVRYSTGRNDVNIQECRWLTPGDWNQIIRAELQFW
jgi:hypothetical protein